MDDGSTDGPGTPRLPPPAVISLQAIGLSAGRNVAAPSRRARLAFLDSADVWLPIARASRSHRATNGAAFTYFADPAEEGVGRTVWEQSGFTISSEHELKPDPASSKDRLLRPATILLYSDLLRRHPRPARHHRRELRRRLASAHWLRAKVKREERGPGASIAPAVRSLITSPGFFAGKLLRAAASTSPQTNTSASSGIDAMPSGTNPKNRNAHTHTARPTRFSAPR